jgi:hypothetical protein
MFRKMVLAVALASVAFSAHALTVSVNNKVVSIQFANGVTFVKDYSPFCSTSIGVQGFSSSQNGVTVESVNVNCVTVTTIPRPPYVIINRRLIETVLDR